MNISIKQLLDLISLSIMATADEKDGTVTNPNPEGPCHYYSPVCTEAGRILGNEASIDDCQAINDHIAAIRLGMRIANK